MAGAAAGGFVTRSFELMLKGASVKKYTSLQNSIQSYLDNVNRVVASGDAQEAKIKSTTDKSKSDKSQEPSSEEAAHVSEPVVLSRTIADALTSAGQTLEAAEAELVLNPLRPAFETKNVKIVEYALDCFHKLIAYDHIEGDAGLEGGKNAPLFSDILNMACPCVDNSAPDSTVLQVLKVLLTAVASTKFRVHAKPLLGVLRVCCNIALNSKSPINQATLKAMLTQTISIILGRMEIDLCCQWLKRQPELYFNQFCL